MEDQQTAQVGRSHSLGTVTWDGVTHSKTLRDEEAKLRHTLADLAKTGNWPKLLSLLAENKNLINAARPDGTSGFAPLHQAAYLGATLETATELINLGAWRTLRDSSGERPLDIARARSHAHLLALLEPALVSHVPTAVLSAIEAHFHALIRKRADSFVVQHALRLPQLEPMLEFPPRRFSFAIPGMYGGFAYELITEEAGPKLISESWCRVSEGSGQRHEITADGTRLIEEGFV